MSSIDLSTLNLNEIYNKAVKYEELRNKQKEHNIKYEKRKREEKDIHFLNKKKEYAKKYYEKNKEKVDKKNLERYHNKKKPISSEEVI
jgi:hypothetical protein